MCLGTDVKRFGSTADFASKEHVEATASASPFRQKVSDTERQTIIVFDWDDTLLCTSYLAQWEGRSLPAVVARHLQGVESLVRHLLETALRLGETYIITNASRDWVTHTASVAMPEIVDLLRKVSIISARDAYAEQHPNDMAAWKRHAFLQLQTQFHCQRPVNVVSFGDSTYEMDAAHTLSAQFSHAHTKTIKFQQHPTSEELLKQLKVVAPKIETIVKAEKSLKIGLERKLPSAAEAA